MKRKTKCRNGNTVERFYDVKDASGNQVGDADYSGDKTSADFATRVAIRDNGGAL